MQGEKQRLRMGLLGVVGLVLVGGAWPAAAQVKGGSGATGSPSSPAPQTLSKDDQRLAGELLDRGMDNLLDYFLNKNHVPLEEQKAIKSSKASSGLTSALFDQLPLAEQNKRIREIVDNVPTLLAAKHTGTQLVNEAGALILKGETRYLNMLEYWGENAKTQAALAPIADAVDKILSKAIADSDATATALMSQMTTPNDPRLPQWQAASELAESAKYTQAFARYALALSLDKADPRRKEVCDQGIKTLAQYDEADQPVQIAVEKGIAKLNLAKGDYDQATKFFDKILANAKASANDQYEARYFKVVVEMLNKKFDDAEKDRRDLVVWEKSKLSADAQPGVEAAAAMLGYRLALAQGKTDLAVQTLLALIAQRPDLKGIISDQLLEKLPTVADLSKVDALVLEAMLSRGEEVAKHGKADQPPAAADAKEIYRAIDAAKEIIARAKAGRGNISADELHSTMLRLPILLDRIEQDAVASDLFMDFAQAYPKDTHADECLNRALYIVLDELRKDPKTKEMPETIGRYDRVLELAFGRGRNEYAYALGLRFKDRKDWKRAAETFAKVPPPPQSTAVQAVMGKYCEMYCDNQLMAPNAANLTAVDRSNLQSRIQALADQIDKGIEQAMSATSNVQDKQRLQGVRVLTILTACDRARANNDFRRTVALLDGIEAKVNGLPEATAFLSEALFQRADAQSALGQNDAALATLQQLLASTTDPQRTVDMIEGFLAKLNDEYIEAGKYKNDAMLHRLSAQRAQLSALLIKQLDKDPKNPKRVVFLKFNASAQRQAAELEKDPQKKRVFLAEATETYTKLLKDTPGDDGLKFDLALCEFDLAEIEPQRFVQAQKDLKDLVPKLGKPEITVTDPKTHDEIHKANPVYWQGVYEYLRSNVEVAKLDPARQDLLSGTRESLRVLLVTYPKPPMYEEEFLKLRQEILPDWDTNVNPATKPTTKPMAPPAPGGR